MQWTDRIRQIKILLVVIAIIIAVASLFVSRMLTRDLMHEERNKVSVWADAMRSLSMADENTDLELVLKVTNNNTTIPVVVMGQDGQAQLFRNISCPSGTYEDSLRYATELGRRLAADGKVIRISLDMQQGEPDVRAATEYVDVCYDESTLLRRLEFYPIIQLGIVMIFVVVAIFALLTSKRAEQNKV